ncbi:hypothetical protein KIM67_11855 [Flagellimonas sp. 389]|uniref:hypothetical protein n=1 Tax=Flagellimonas sp. 389 TaxID=2835862 RepID=UPI001BD20C2E|nr:hypothetical protein [Flagellimonas sp. 389]MBS9463107.1 hypothetical protein [Flagellimonas sp. 389]
MKKNLYLFFKSFNYYFLPKRMIRTPFILFLAIVAIFFTSCSKSTETPQPPEPPEPPIPVNETVAINATASSLYTTNDFEPGEMIEISVFMTAPEGIQQFDIEKIVNGGTATSIRAAIEDAGGTMPDAGATAFDATYMIPVDGALDDVVKIVFKAKDADSEFESASYDYDVVAQGQGGGGGVFPLLRAKATVDLGSQIGAKGGYLATDLGESGVFTKVEAGALSSAEQQAIDITFGVTNGDGEVGTSTPSLLSPDARADANFNNPLGDNASTTTFKVEELKGLDNVTSTDVENNIDHTSESNAIQNVQEGEVYSYINATGAKGYIKILTITGANDNRVATVEFLVQIVM